MFHTYVGTVGVADPVTSTWKDEPTTYLETDARDTSIIPQTVVGERFVSMYPIAQKPL